MDVEIRLRRPLMKDEIRNMEEKILVIDSEKPKVSQPEEPTTEEKIPFSEPENLKEEIEQKENEVKEVQEEKEEPQEQPEKELEQVEETEEHIPEPRKDILDQSPRKGEKVPVSPKKQAEPSPARTEEKSPPISLAETVANELDE